MTIQSHWLDQFMISAFDKEATYDGGPSAWLAANACSMLDFDDASGHEEWDDAISDNAALAGQEFAKTQEIARQSVRVTYTEPKAKPNTLAALMSLALGTVTSAQDGVEDAYRHKIDMAAAHSLPSIGMQTKHESGRQYIYTGVKSNGYTLSWAQEYLQFQTLLIGSGTRATASDAFPAAISENWLKWGDAKIFVKATGGSAISIPATPTQGSANLGGSEVELSSRIVSFTHQLQNNMQDQLGYRAGGGKSRSNLHPARRVASVTMGLEVETTSEATDLDYYLNQTKLALELNLDTSVLIDAQGVFKFGLILVIPQVQFRSIGRAAEGEREVLNFEAAAMDDGTNPALVGWVYNAQTTYLA